MPEFIDVFHYPREKDSFSRPEILQHFLQELAAQGYYLARDEQEEMSKDPGPSDPARLFVPGVSQALWQEVERFRQGEINELSIVIYSAVREGEVRGVEYRVTLYPKAELIRAVMDDIYPDSQPYRRFLDLLELLYNTWHPIFGYRDDGVRPGTDLEDARTGNIVWLYDINVWGPELVEHMGRERVLRSPAWRLTTLQDGGVLIVPQLYYSDGQAGEYTCTGDDAARHLGLHWEPPDERS